MSAELSPLRILVGNLNNLKYEYLKVFKSFEMSKLQELMSTSYLKGPLINQWVEENDINLFGLKLEKVLAQGLLDTPDFTALIDSINVAKRLINHLSPRYANLLRANVSLIYNPELELFPSPEEGETEIYNLVRRSNTATTETDEEVEFIEEIRTYARLYVKFHTLGLVIDREPRTLFIWLDSDRQTLYIPPRALITFRDAANRE
jgi:hypothetical protein